MQNSKNFVNPSFAAIFDGITAHMPAITFWGIIVTYAITAALNVHFIPLPLYLSIPAALAIQFGRFAVVFMDFLNPTGTRSPWPGTIATVATLTAMAELAFSLAGMKQEGSEFWALFLFGGMVIAFGYILELNFIRKGAEAFGMTGKVHAPGAATQATRPHADTAPTLTTVTAGNARTRATEPPVMDFFDLSRPTNGNGKH